MARDYTEAEIEKAVAAVLEDRYGPFVSAILPDEQEDVVRSVRIALSAVPRMPWQPIETAPNGGNVIVIGGRYEEPEIIPADGDWWRTCGLIGVPTHWMPLSEPPEDQNG
jgi:hypothetical protein